MQQIGTSIAHLRKNHGMTQEELSASIGVSAQTVSKWETGTTMPDILLLPVIADIFNVTVDTFSGGKHPMMRPSICKTLLIPPVSVCWIPCKTQCSG